MFNWFVIASFVIIIPALIAAIRFSVIDEVFKPLAYNLWIGLFAEILAYILRVTIKNNLYVYNVFFYFDLLTILWLFYRWGTFEKISQSKIIIFITFFSLLWVWDNLYQHHLGENNFIFRISYSLVLLLIAIDQLNNVIIKSNYSLFHNPYIFITLGIIFYYTYCIFISLLISPLFRPSIQLWKWNMLIYVIINVVINLLFAISFIWMRKKVKFT
jgi:hypothetical protein